MARLPTYYISHGGGPCFFMDWTMGPPDTWKRMEAFLRGLGAQVGDKPKAVLVISAHWEESTFTVLTAPKPELYYDYYGFPAHTYRLSYPAANAPEVIARLGELMQQAGLELREDSARGYDHGVFVPLLLTYPEAEIPVVQLSLKRGLDPAAHVALGKALAPLRDEGVLILGSGMSFHNFAGFNNPAFTARSETFDRALTEAVCAPQDERERRLIDWQSLPQARAAHAREEHLLPLMVVAGAGGADVGQCVYTDHVMAVATSAYRFG